MSQYLNISEYNQLLIHYHHISGTHFASLARVQASYFHKYFFFLKNGYSRATKQGSCCQVL